jgi:cysteinyl-tRNA synthetase
MPHAAPRVTDHMREIVAFIGRIEDVGLAYAAGEGDNKSVYFDVAAFRKAGHVYGKLEPWAVGSAELASESEGNFTTKEKKSEQVHFIKTNS